MQIVTLQAWARLHFHSFLMTIGVDTTGEKEVCCPSASSGLDKRQYTIQLTIFAGGVPRARPMIIFCGKGKRMSANEELLGS